MEIIALKKFTYAGKKHFAGDRLSVRRKDGRAFIFIGKASAAPEVEEAATFAVTEKFVEEVVEEVIRNVIEEVIEEVVEGKQPRKRTYRRRDLTAETE